MGQFLPVFCCLGKSSGGGLLKYTQEHRVIRVMIIIKEHKIRKFLFRIG